MPGKRGMQNWERRGRTPAAPAPAYRSECGEGKGRKAPTAEWTRWAEGHQRGRALLFVERHQAWAESDGLFLFAACLFVSLPDRS